MTNDVTKALAEALINLGQTLLTTVAPDAEQAAPETAPEPAAKAPKKASPKASAVSLEQVRAKLADLSRAGHTAEVKALIAEQGAEKLSDVAPDRFGDLLAAADRLAA